MRERSRNFVLVTEVPERRPEGALIESAREHRVPKLSARAAAAQAGISDGRWRQIANGYISVGTGHYAPVIAPADTLARMAKVVGVSPEQLADVGRGDAAGELVRLNREPASVPVGTGIDPVDLASLSPEEIEAVRAVIRAMRARHGGEG